MGEINVHGASSEAFAEAIIKRNAGDWGGCIQALERVLRRGDAPDHGLALAWNERGAALQKVGHPFDSVINYDLAIALWPDNAGFHCNRGSAFFEQEMFGKAMECYDRALALNPGLAEAELNRANIYMRQNRTALAAETYRSALDKRPGYHDARLGLAVSLLKLGELKEGWREFECRWETDQLPRRRINAPEWGGEEAADPSQGLYLYGEQGMGDVIQFARYCRLARERWKGRVYLEVRLPLARLMQSLAGVDRVVSLGEKIPADVVASMALLSLPRVLGTDAVADVPGECPYLYADDRHAVTWRKNLQALPPARMMVGACWAGMNRSHDLACSAIDARRSTKLEQWSELAKLPGVSWVSLQMGPPAAEACRAPYGMTIGDWSGEIEDWFDTAAIIANLDLVISVDTAVAHLAAAMGRPTWLLSRYEGCWRWLEHGRRDSPWYPSMRIFWQDEPGDWKGVMERVARELNDLPRSQRRAA